MFDPYAEWLGIPKDQRPINCYRLLGVSRKESDSSEISRAALERSELVLEHQDGPHGELCARLLKEIAQAKAMLTNPAKRKEYDARLRSKQKNQAEEIAEVEAVEEAAPTKGKPKSAKAEPARKRPPKPEKKSSAMLFVVLGGIAVLSLLVVGGGVGAYLIFGGKSEPTRVQQAAATPTTKQQSVVSPPTKPATTKAEAPKTPAKKPDPPKPPAPKPPARKPPQKKPMVAKLPVPSDAAQATAEKALKEKYKTEYAKTKPEDKLALAAKFLQPGREDRKDPAAWFVLLREARDLSIEANRPRLAVEAIDEIDRWFVIDALEMKIKALTAVDSKNSETVAIAARYRVVLNLIEQAYDVENFEAARRLLEIIESAMKNIQATELLKLVREDKSELDGFVGDFQQVRQAKSKLAPSPDDPEANRVVGQYLCFFQNKWDEGLPLLAKCADAELKNLATKDLAEPAAVKEQLAIADGWWAKARGLKDRQQHHIANHARMWYERSGPNTQGEDRAKVINRIREAQEKEYARITHLFPGSFYGRDTENRILLLRQGGGTMQSEEAVEAGLEWLAKHQNPTGSWTTDRFAVQGCNCTEKADKGQKHDIAGTAFGMMPFIGAGETHHKGKHAGVIARGLSYLLSHQKRTGNFHDNGYENALATTVVVELYGITKDKSLLPSAVAATNYIILAQDSTGGWGYTPKSKPDTSVSGWQFTALKAAAFAGLKVPPETFNRLSRFLDTVADANGNGYGYNTPGAGAATSAVGILCREFLSWGPGHPALDKGADSLLQTGNFPSKKNFNMYAAFYITQAAHHLGGRHWEKWNGAVRDLLIELQDKGNDPKHAHQKGSWSPNKAIYAKEGGRLMFTSLALITLEAYYYHIPLYGYKLELLLD